MSEESMTSRRHNDYVGSNANAGRIPGAEKATTGHHYISVFPKDGAQKRAEEHLPPPTGRDLPPKGVSPDTANQFVERHITSRNTSDTIGSGQPRAPSPVHQQAQQTHPLPPAPDSRTVIDRDPFAEPVTAGDTLTGATSKDVYRGTGVPAGGMTSKEVHHDGAAHRKRGKQGVEQFGSAGEVFEE